ncbi:preprotein translocase subunit SecG [bacterium]|nr:preprotein translocase subunit SecG [bacterium]
MDLKNILLIAQIAISSILVILILLQQRGQALGGTFGGGGEFYLKRRGVEKKIFIATIVFAVLFIAASLLRFIV